MLKENLESFIQPVYSKTRRSFDTYDSLKKRCTLKITELAEEYRTIEHNAQALREIRNDCLLYTSPSPRDVEESRMPSSA